ncbi:MAG: hypothetical protein JJU18_01830 [Oceanicaulis sp.]|nr:hypothetical protein [Oceanicaulis sp.]
MNHVLTILMALVLAGAIFIFDHWTPLGFAHGLLYLFPVILLRHESLPIQSGMALLATVLMVLGYFNSPAGFLNEYVILNRGLSGLAVWIIVILQMDRRATALRINGQKPASP